MLYNDILDAAEAVGRGSSTASQEIGPDINLSVKSVHNKREFKNQAAPFAFVLGPDLRQ